MNRTWRQEFPRPLQPKRDCRQSTPRLISKPVVTDVDHTNIGDLLDQVDVILDGTDNFETRFLLNDAALQFDIPWIYGGCIGAEGQTMTIVPG